MWVYFFPLWWMFSGPFQPGSSNPLALRYFLNNFIDHLPLSVFSFISFFQHYLLFRLVLKVSCLLSYFSNSVFFNSNPGIFLSSLSSNASVDIFHFWLDTLILRTFFFYIIWFLHHGWNIFSFSPEDINTACSLNLLPAEFLILAN